MKANTIDNSVQSAVGTWYRVSKTRHLRGIGVESCFHTVVLHVSNVVCETVN